MGEADTNVGGHLSYELGIREGGDVGVRGTAEGPELEEDEGVVGVYGFGHL